MTCPTNPTGNQRIPMATPDTVIETVNRLAKAHNSVFLGGGGAVTVDTLGQIRDPDYATIGSHGAVAFIKRRVSQTGDFTYAASLGDFVVASSLSGTPDVTLPAASTGVGGIVVLNTDNAAINITVTRAGSDTVYDQPGSGTSILVGDQDSVLFVSDGSSVWATF